jgi:hypothetical protein
MSWEVILLAALIAIFFIFIPLALLGMTSWATLSAFRLFRLARRQEKAQSEPGYWDDIGRMGDRMTPADRIKITIQRRAQWEQLEEEAKTPCAKCGGARTVELSPDGPRVFCVECGDGSWEYR